MLRPRYGSSNSSASHLGIFSNESAISFAVSLWVNIHHKAIVSG